MEKLSRAILIEPDALFREALKKVLEREGFKVLEACCLGEALPLILGSNVSLITTELKLPDSEGPETIDRLLDVSPDSQVIILTAFPELIPNGGSDRYSIENVIFMRKPVGLKDLLERISCPQAAKTQKMKDKMSGEISS